MGQNQSSHIPPSRSKTPKKSLTKFDDDSMIIRTTNPVYLTPEYANADPYANTWGSHDNDRLPVAMRDVLREASSFSDHLAIVYYYFDKNLPKKYQNMVENAIRDMEEAAPGIQFQRSNTAKNRIRIFYGEGCNSFVGMIGDIQDLQLAEWARKGHVLHELMHALGFIHEHQRTDRDKYVKCYSIDNINYGIEGVVIGRYDADSIMHYPCQNGVLEDRNLWATYQREHLSNGDKIALNKAYPSVRRSGVYQPKKGRTCLYYCGRHNMEDNNSPFGKIGTDGYCGPNIGPNCPSCRQYGGVSKRRNDEERAAIQGETGLFYCRIRFITRAAERQGHDGVCGPNNGPNCNSCRRLLEI